MMLLNRKLLKVSIVICLLSMSVSIGYAQDDDNINVNPDVTFLDQMATNGLPGLFSELAGAAADSGMQNFVAQGWQGGQAAKELAASAGIRNDIAKYNQWLGRIAGAIDFVGKVGSEQYDEAFWSGGLTILGELAGTSAGKSVLASVGCTSTAPVTALILAIQVYRESEKQATEAETGRLLESLYGGMENMLRVRGRKLGDGSDPFPVTKENEEKVWKRILSDADFRGRFGLYVKDQLNQEWPEPGFFDKMDAYVADPIISLASGQSTPKGGYAQAAANPNAPQEASTAADRLEMTAQSMLNSQKSQIMTYIGGLISALNRAAKREESRMAALRTLRELQAFFKNNGASLEEGLKKMDSAGKMLPEVTKYADGVGPYVEKLIKEKRYTELCIAKSQISIYVRDCIRWLPTKGPLGNQRNDAYTKLRSAYGRALNGIGQLRKEMDDRAKEPQWDPPAADNGNYVSPESYYSIFEPFVKPFDWGKHSEINGFRENYVSCLKSGQFRSSGDGYSLPEGREPLAEMIEQAWKVENYNTAYSRPSRAASVEPGSENQTIKGYFQELRAKIYDKHKPENLPGDIKSAINTRNQAYASYQAALSSAKNPFEPSVVAAQKAYHEADAIVQARSQAFEIAYNSAVASIAEYEAAAKTEHSDFMSWMADIKATYDKFAAESAVKARELSDSLRGVSNALYDPDAKGSVSIQFNMDFNSVYNDFNGQKIMGALYVTLEEAQRLLSEVYSGSGLSKMADTVASGGFGNWAESQTNSQFSKMITTANEVRSNYNKLASEVAGMCESMEAAVEQYDDLVEAAQPYLDDIRTYYSPDFWQDGDFEKIKSKRSATPGRISELRGKAQSMQQAAETAAGNWETDAFYIRRIGRKILMWVENRKKDGVWEESWGTDGTQIHVSNSSNGVYDAFMLSIPYPHLMTDAEKDRLVGSARSEWTGSNLNDYTKKYAPGLQKVVDEYIAALENMKTVSEDNFLLCSDMGTTMYPITASKLDEAEKTIAGAAVGTPEFSAGLLKLVSLLPLELERPGSGSEKWRELSEKCLKSPLAPRYMALRNKLKELLPLHYTELEAYNKRENERLANEARQKLPALLEQLRQRIAQGNNMIKDSTGIDSKDKAALKKALTEMEDFHFNKMLSEPYQSAQQASSYLNSVYESEEPLYKEAYGVFLELGKLSGPLYDAEASLKSRLASADDDTPEIRKFYEEFKRSYEMKMDSKVMSFIGDSWSAGDGTTLDDLQEHLRNSFSVFDEIRYNMVNLNINKSGEGKYKVSYDVTITGRIFDNNLKHEEKSSVTEEVGVDSKGKVKIIRTLEGRFWYVN